MAALSLIHIYEKIIKSYLKDSFNLLDYDTGGGVASVYEGYRRRNAFSHPGAG